MDITNIYASASTDLTFVSKFGAFIRHHRLAQNLTQSDLARNAGMNRSTLIEFEQGKNSKIITFVQLLRVLNLLHVLSAFDVKDELSPILLAEAQLNQRRRASSKKKIAPKRKSNW